MNPKANILPSFFSLFVLVFIAISCSHSELSRDATPDLGTENITAVIFDNTMTIQDLTEIRTEMSDLGISLEYKNLSFDESGKLAAISFEVDCNDGYHGSATTKHLNEDNTIGFLIDRNVGASPSFATGGISQWLK